MTTYGYRTADSWVIGVTGAVVIGLVAPEERGCCQYRRLVFEIQDEVVFGNSKSVYI